MEIKFALCEKVFFFNTATRRIEKAEIKGIQVVPTGISKGEDGENRLDGCVVFYSTVEGAVLSGNEVFASEEECRETYRKFFAE